MAPSNAFGVGPMRPDWARSLRDQCQAAGVAYHFKQWGAWLPVSQVQYSNETNVEPATSGDLIKNGARGHVEIEQGKHALRVGKKRAGRLLDGRNWDEYPPQIISHFEGV